MHTILGDNHCASFMVKLLYFLFPIITLKNHQSVKKVFFYLPQLPRKAVSSLESDSGHVLWVCAWE